MHTVRSSNWTPSAESWPNLSGEELVFVVVGDSYPPPWPPCICNAVLLVSNFTASRSGAPLRRNGVVEVVESERMGVCVRVMSSRYATGAIDVIAGLGDLDDEGKNYRG